MTNPMIETGEKGMTHEAGIHAFLDQFRKDQGFDGWPDRCIQAYLSASGMVLVPRDLTEEMEDEGAGAYHDIKNRLTAERLEAGRNPTVFPADWLKPTYAAMINAAADPFNR